MVQKQAKVCNFCGHISDGLSVVLVKASSGGVAPTVITATVRIIREVSATAVKALPV